MEESIPWTNKEIEEFLAGTYLNYENCMIKLEDIEALGFDIEKIFQNRFFSVVYLTNPTNQVGHFTLLSHFDDAIEYFDSTGNPTPDIIKKFARKNKMKLIENKKKMQGTTSNTCAKWVISRILSLPLQLGNYQKIFTSHRYFTPDEIVNNLYVYKKDF